MKSPVSGVTIARWVPGADGAVRRSRTAKTWTLATELIVAWAEDDETSDAVGHSLLVVPRWRNGLVLYEIGFSIAAARNIKALGHAIRRSVFDNYGTRRRRSRSLRATMARECLAACAFDDDECSDMSGDVRAMDAARRALLAYFGEDEAAPHIAWLEERFRRAGVR